MNWSRKSAYIFIGLGVLGALYILPLTLASRYFVHGHVNGLGWATSDDSLLNVPSYMLPGILGLSIFYQMFAMGILVFCVWVLVRHFLPEASIFWGIVLGFLFLSSPYLLGNLSFRQDSLVTAVSILFSICAALIAFRRKRNFLLVFLFSLGIFFTYKASFTVMINICMISLFIGGLHRESTSSLLRDVTSRLFLLLCAYLTYICLANFFLGGPSSEHNRLLLLEWKSAQFLREHFFFVMGYLGTVFQDPAARYIFFPAFFFGLFYTTLQGIKLILEKPREAMHWVLGIFMGLSMFIMLLVAIIPSILFMAPPYQLQVYVGFCPLFFFVFVCMYRVLSKRNILRYGWYFLLLPILYMVVLSYSYGNLEKFQWRHENQLMNSVVQDLGAESKIQKILFIGRESSAPENLLVEKKFPYLRLLASNNLTNLHIWWNRNHLDQNTFFRGIKVYYWGGGALFPGPMAQEILAESRHHNILRTTSTYSIKIFNNTAVITFSPLPELEFSR